MTSKKDALCVSAIRALSAAAVQKAKSGHPGLPLGAAPAAYALYGRVMNVTPECQDWFNRDRFVLSAGHGSALLYSLLHLFGFGLTVEDLKQFRQFGSKTPGHPEYGHTPGIETTTGPLGQGVSNAVGMAIAEKYLAAKFNSPRFPVVDHYTYALVGDGCMMEGISSEACSLAGTLELSKLIVLYDDNGISIEGDTDISFKEDVGARFEAYHWQVLTVEDGNDVEAIVAAIVAAKADARPSLIVVKTEIGYGSPRQGQASAHGEPLGEENLAAMLTNIGWPSTDAFAVPAEVYETCRAANKRSAHARDEWNKLMLDYRASCPELAATLDAYLESGKPVDLSADADFFKFEGKAATRNSSGEALARLTARVPSLIGGSADLAPSNKTYIKGRGDFSASTPDGANLHFGVREHAMAAIANGVALHGGLRIYVGTFFVFCDYMKHAMRLSAMMHLPVLYVLTHDSIGVGEDGPTHEPVEQLAMLRSIPNLITFRPADSREVAAGYAAAMKHDGPTAMILTRQDLPLYERSGPDAMKGGYIISPSKKDTPDVLLIASGSEVEQCVAAQAVLAGKGVDALVISMPSFELFNAQTAEYRESVLPSAVRARLGVEAATPFGWHQYVGLDGDIIAMNGYGASGPYKTLFEHFGFTVDNIVGKTLALVKK